MELLVSVVFILIEVCVKPDARTLKHTIQDCALVVHPVPRNAHAMQCDVLRCALISFFLKKILLEVTFI